MIIALLFGSFALAENTVTQSGTTATITPDMSVVQNNDISTIGMVFCDDDVIKGIPTDKKFSFDTQIDMRPGQRKNICTAFVNRGDKETTIKIALVEGIKSDTSDTIKCSAYEPNNTFEKYFSFNEEDSLLTLSSGAKIVKIFPIKIPRNATGNIYGCVTYISNAPVEVAPGQVFAIQVRKAGHMNITVTGATYNFGRWNDIKDAYTVNKTIILKVIIAILAVWLILTIVQTGKKKEKPSKKK